MISQRKDQKIKKKHQHCFKFIARQGNPPFFLLHFVPHFFTLIIDKKKIENTQGDVALIFSSVTLQKKYPHITQYMRFTRCTSLSHILLHCVPQNIAYTKRFAEIASLFRKMRRLPPIAALCRYATSHNSGYLTCPVGYSKLFPSTTSDQPPHYMK